jgi:hypothetical protein
MERVVGGKKEALYIYTCQSVCGEYGCSLAGKEYLCPIWWDPILALLI